MAKRIPHNDAPHQPLDPRRPPLGILLLYSTGQFGWSLASFGVSNLLVYFYMPPETGQPVFPAFVYQGAVLAVFTLVGLLSAAGRFLDAAIDPLIANWSDRSRARAGKRRWFMLWGAVPFAALSALVFFPLDAAESAANFLWLALALGLYYFFFAFYVIPYNALLAELGHTAADRMRISTLLSVAWALGFVAGNSAYALQVFFEHQGQSPTEAFQNAVALLNGVALVFLLLPALFLNEHRYARQTPSEHHLWKSLRAVFADANYRVFLKSDLLYWLALTFIQLGVGFYVTLLLGLDKSQAFTFSVVSFLSSFAFYAPVLWLERRLGKRRLMLLGFEAFAVIFAVVGIAAALPVSKQLLLYALGVAAAWPLAVFGILPNALIGDLVAAKEKAGEPSMAGMFFGVRAFVMKIGISLANLIFPSLLLFGRSAERPLGVQLTTVAAIAFSLGGWWIFRRYREVS